MKRNLIYFIYWDNNNGMLDYNLSFMDKYIHLFDGQVIIKIAGDHDISLNTLRNYPWLKKAKFVLNDPILHEAPHFKESLKELNTDQDSITFYAHAKGVSRKVNNPLLNWVRLMYEGNLSEVPDLSDKLFSGCFGKLRKGSKQVPVPWHYSGSFYWFNTRKVLDRIGKVPKEIDNRWFTESFPGWIAKQNEVGFKIHASAEMKYNLYSEDFWVRNKHLLT